MSQQRVFLLFTTGIVGLVFLGCVILGVTIYINLPAWLPPSATPSDRPSGAAAATGPAPAPWHIQAPPESATPPTTLTREPVLTDQPENAAPLATRTPAPVTLPANATLSPQPPQAVATPTPARTADLPTIAAIPAGTPSSPTPTASAVISPVATGTSGPTGAASTARPTASSTSTPTWTATPSPSPTVVQGGGGGLRGEAGGMAVTVVSVTRHDDAGLIELVVEVILENVSRNEEVYYHPLFFGLQDSEGNGYEASLFAPDPSLTEGALALGASDRGNVAFEITQTARGFVLTYDLSSLGGDYEVIQIDLGQ